MLYPLMLNLDRRKVAIIGGGTIAERKAAGLIEAGAIVTIISPNVTAALHVMIDSRKCMWRNKYFESNDIAEFFIIIAATNDALVNQMVKQSAMEHQLVLLIDDPSSSDFQIPALMRRGDLSISISTNGASPKLAKKIKNQLAEQYDERYESYLEFLQQARSFILENVHDSDKKNMLLTKILDERFLNEAERQEAFRRLYEEEA